jgi:hypothetical protein
MSICRLLAHRGFLRMGSTITGFFVALVLVYLAADGGGPIGSASAAELKSPEGRVILRISGQIGNTNAGDAVEFDRAMLETLPTKTIETETPWTDGMIRFEGPLIRDILTLIDAKGSRIKVTAINDYSVEIPVSDIDSYEVILAMKMNGETLRTRTRGPLWVVYPWREKPELRTELFYGRAIWQAKEMIVAD